MIEPRPLHVHATVACVHVNFTLNAQVPCGHEYTLTLRVWCVLGKLQVNMAPVTNKIKSHIHNSGSNINVRV